MKLKPIIVAMAIMSMAAASHSAYLIAPSEADNGAFRAAVSGALGGAQVDYFDAGSATLTLAQMQAYMGIFTWANFSYNNATLFGDRLADYVDAGGRVVLGAFTTYTSGNSLAGRIMTSAYSPVTSASGSNHFSNSAYAGDGSSGLWAGVAAYSAVYRDIVALQGAGIADGTFADGEIAGAYRPDGAVVYVGGMETLTSTAGDNHRLLANALTFSPQAAVPEPGALGLALAALALMSVFSIRRSAGAGSSARHG